MKQITIVGLDGQTQRVYVDTDWKEQEEVFWDYLDDEMEESKASTYE
jgi:hypothetical protein